MKKLTTQLKGAWAAILETESEQAEKTLDQMLKAQNLKQ